MRVGHPSLLQDGFVCRPHDALAAHELLEAVRGPASHARAGEQRGDEVGGDVEHLVDQAGVHVDVRADGLVGSTSLRDDLGRELDDRVDEVELRLVIRALGELASIVAAGEGAMFSLISSSIFTTLMLAPPWRNPLSDPMAPA